MHHFSILPRWAFIDTSRTIKVLATFSQTYSWLDEK
jgi:hypothetical protein